MNAAFIMPRADVRPSFVPDVYGKVFSGSTWPAVFVILGSGGALAAFLYFRNRNRIADKIGSAAAALPAGTQSDEVTLRLTGFWPYAAKESEKRREGGPNAAAVWRGQKAVDPATGKRPVVYTFEQHLAGKAPYVTLSGDPDIWPFGQRVVIDVWPGAIFRYTDTGGHFKGAGKVFRLVGVEPTDVAVDSPNTKVPSTVKARVVSGDSFAPGEIAFSKIGKPSVSGSDAVDAYTSEDVEAVARAIESIPGCTDACARAVAWICRNRAALLGCSIGDLLVPGGEYGPADDRRFASTRRPATEVSLAIADAVLSAPPSEDVSQGAIDFWVPEHQAKLKAMGDLHRFAVERGDDGMAAKFAPFAGYTDGIEAVRAWQAKSGLVPAGRVGPVEILRLSPTGTSSVVFSGKSV